MGIVLRRIGEGVEGSEQSQAQGSQNETLTEEMRPASGSTHPKEKMALLRVPAVGKLPNKKDDWATWMLTQREDWIADEAMTKSNIEDLLLSDDDDETVHNSLASPELCENGE